MYDTSLHLSCRFLLVVLSAYKQMHEQSKPILSDIDEENFDKAFNLFRPSKFGHEKKQ